MRRTNLKQGFTLIETILYAIIFSIVSGAIIMISYSMITYAENTAAQVEISDNSRFLFRKIESVIRGAGAVNHPPVNTSGTYLSFNTATASWNPFVVDVHNKRLRFKRGAEPAYYITNSLVELSSVSFKNYSYSTQTKNTIRIKANMNSVGISLTATKSIDLFFSIR